MISINKNGKANILLKLKIKKTKKSDERKIPLSKVIESEF